MRSFDDRRSLSFRYGIALASIALAIVVRVMLRPVLGEQFPFGALNIAVVVTAWLAGTRPALFALFAGALVSDFCVIGVHRTLGWRSTRETVGLLLFLGTGVAVSLLAGAMHEARRREDESAKLCRFHEALIGQAYEPVLVWRLDGQIVLWNRGAERLYGYSHEEAVGRLSHELLLTEAPEGVAGFLVALERDGLWEGELKHTSRDGRTILVDSRMTLIREGDGAYVLEANRDITRRKTMEEALLSAEDEYRMLVEGVSDHAILTLDQTGIIQTWSRGAEMIDGYSADEIIGQHYSCLFTPENVRAGLPERELEQAAAKGKVDVEGWRIRKNGATFWVNGTLSALYDADGKVRGFAKITRDLTAKRHDDELLQSVLNHTLDGIITIDDRGMVSMINRAGEAVFGYSASEVVGRNVNLLMPELYGREHDGSLANEARSGEAKVIGVGKGREIQGLRKDGSVFPIDLAVTEFQLDSTRYFVGIVRDVSDKKTLEAQLQQSQKMEAFGQLAGGVAHDFNNLLTVISGYAELLKEELQPPDARLEMVDQILQAGERAAGLTRQLLAFSRRQLLEPKVLNVNTVVVEIEQMLVRLIGEHIELSKSLGAKLSPVKVDAGQLGQVITNLCLNARDAMPKGGKIAIETREVELDEGYVSNHREVRCGRYVMVAVNDTGCGMTVDVQARIFEPFFTTKPVGEGTGLGLAVAHGIIKQSGGSIEVYSEAGVGTAFRIYLPALDQPVAAAHAELVELPPRGVENIFLVEDEDSLRNLGIAMLQRCGYTVLSASNGEHALQVLADSPDRIDLLVTDVVMPRMGGRRLAEILQAERPGLKVLFLSGYTDDAVVRHGILQANVNFLQKPFSLRTLSKRVREILDQA